MRITTAEFGTVGGPPAPTRRTVLPDRLDATDRIPACPVGRSARYLLMSGCSSGGVERTLYRRRLFRITLIDTRNSQPAKIARRKKNAPTPGEERRAAAPTAKAPAATTAVRGLCALSGAFPSLWALGSSGSRIGMNRIVRTGETPTSRMKWSRVADQFTWVGPTTSATSPMSTAPSRIAPARVRSARPPRPCRGRVCKARRVLVPPHALGFLHGRYAARWWAKALVGGQDCKVRFNVAPA